MFGHFGWSAFRHESKNRQENPNSSGFPCSKSNRKWQLESRFKTKGTGPASHKIAEKKEKNRKRLFVIRPLFPAFRAFCWQMSGEQVNACVNVIRIWRKISCGTAFAWGKNVRCVFVYRKGRCLSVALELSLYIGLSGKGSQHWIAPSRCEEKSFEAWQLTIIEWTMPKSK